MRMKSQFWEISSFKSSVCSFYLKSERVALFSDRLSPLMVNWRRPYRFSPSVEPSLTCSKFFAFLVDILWNFTSWSCSNASDKGIPLNLTCSNHKNRVSLTSECIPVFIAFRRSIPIPDAWLAHTFFDWWTVLNPAPYRTLTNTELHCNDYFFSLSVTHLIGEQWNQKLLHQLRTGKGTSVM